MLRSCEVDDKLNIILHISFSIHAMLKTRRQILILSSTCCCFR
jgi:hypothetical protein